MGSAPGGDSPSEYSWSKKSDDSVVDYSVWVQELLWYKRESLTKSSKCIEDLSRCIEELRRVNDKEEVCIVDKDTHQRYPPHCDIRFLGMRLFFRLFKLCELGGYELGNHQTLPLQYSVTEGPKSTQ